MRCLPRSILIFSLVIPLVMATTAAAADEPAPSGGAVRGEALARFNKGAEFYKQAEYKLALIEFERAYQLAPHYRVLYNIGQVNSQLGNYAKALSALRRYLDEGGTEISESRRAIIEDDVAALLDRVASIRIMANVAADVLVDEVPVGKAPMNDAVLVDAGQHVIRVSAAGYDPQSRIVVLAGRDKSDLRFDLKPEKGPVFVGVRDQKPSPVPLIVSWSATGLFVVTGMLTGILSLNAQATHRSLRDSGTYVSQSDFDAVESRARTYAIVADVSFGAAIVSAAVATYLTLRPDPKPAAAKTGLAVSPTGLAGAF